MSESISQNSLWGGAVPLSPAQPLQKSSHNRKVRSANRHASDIKYQENNREKILQSKRTWYKNNKEQILEAVKKRRAEHSEEINARRRALHQENLEANRAKSREYHHRTKERRRMIQIKSSYGLFPEAYIALLERQEGVCAICGGINSNGRALSVDHDHKTGEVRGLLCSGCNVGLGSFRDDLSLLSNAMVYLRPKE